MKSNPEVIELDEADLESKLDQIEAVLGADVAQPFRLLLRWYACLLGLLREKKLSIRRLQRMLFGAPTERTSSVLASTAASSGQAEDASAENAADAPARPPETPSMADNQGHSSASDRSASRRRRPGHGRIPAGDYTGCAKVVVTHASLRPGDACPHCGSGTVYRQSRWSPVVRLKGQPPITGQVYQLERLRCGECGDPFTAELPEEAGPDKYDASVPATIATLRYGDPTWNLKRLQACTRDFTHHAIDIRDRAAVLRFFKETAVDFVIHAAAQPSHDLARKRPFDHFDVNAMAFAWCGRKRNRATSATVSIEVASCSPWARVV